MGFKLNIMETLKFYNNKKKIIQTIYSLTFFDTHWKG